MQTKPRKMFQRTIYLFLTYSAVQAQLNGEFWWMNSKLINLKNGKPTPPKIDLSDFQSEESSKIIFRDDDLFSNKLKPFRDRTPKLIPSRGEESKVVWPKEEHMKSHDVEVFATQGVIVKPEPSNPEEVKSKLEDVLIFSYPKNEKLVVSTETNKLTTETENNTNMSDDKQNTLKVTENLNNAESSKSQEISTVKPSTKAEESQNICTYTSKKNCKQLNGVVYEYARRIPESACEEPFVCCILPSALVAKEPSIPHTIYFPQSQSAKRYKRSNSEITDIIMNQRDFLLKHKFSPQRINIRPLTTPLTKIVTPPEDDYEDPYWNIKNTKIHRKKPNMGSDNPPDYIEDTPEYADEIPRPGLIGLYSDHEPSPSNWPFADGNKGFSYGGEEYVDEVDDDDETFGYSTIDPRQEIKKKKKVKPTQLTTTSDEISYDAERHTISFQSNPDFHVFQGFKLLNLFRNTSRNYNKKVTNQETEDLEVILGSPDDGDEIAEGSEEVQLFEGCGKFAKKTVKERGNEGEAPNGAAPWLALVVLTKSRHNVLCYATLIHPRAAITIGDCTQGTAPGDITVIAGLWDLHDRSSSKNRVATVHVHPKYKPGEVDNNLALLNWMQPLQLSRNIQPACLAEPRVGQECRLYGWGNLEQGIRQARPKWQRAVIRSCPNINTRNKMSGEAFCVSTSRSAVTGIGGPLICQTSGHSSMVGVVVSRESKYILSPVRDWTMKMENLVTGD